MHLFQTYIIDLFLRIFEKICSPKSNAWKDKTQDKRQDKKVKTSLYFICEGSTRFPVDNKNQTNVIETRNATSNKSATLAHDDNVHRTMFYDSGIQQKPKTKDFKPSSCWTDISSQSSKRNWVRNCLRRSTEEWSIECFDTTFYMCMTDHLLISS